MGNNTAANAVVGKPKVSGGILTAPVGTALPASESANPNVAFVSPGYLADSGFTRSEKTDQEVKKAWGGDPLIVIDKGTTFTAKLGLAEYLNPIVQALIYGDANITTTAATSAAGNKMKIVGKNVQSPHRSWIIDVFSGDAVGRIVFPDVQIAEREDYSYKDDDLAVRGVTLLLFPNSLGDYFYEYWDDGRKVLGA